MKKQQAGFIGIAIVAVVAVLGLAAIGGWVYVEKSKTSNIKSEVATETSDQNQVQNTTGTQQAVNTEVRIEFPWGNYSKTVNARAASTNSKLVGQTINIGGFSKATLVVGESINVGGGSKIGTMYVFKDLTMAADSSIDVLYLSSAKISTGKGVTIGKKVYLPHNELVNNAKYAVGIATNTSSGATTSSGGATNVSNTTTASPAPTTNTTQTTTSVSYTGSWNGTFTANAIAASQGCPGGEVAFNVASDGTFQGPVTIKGIVYYGGGNVDKNGKMSGGWSLSGGSKISLTGQLGASTGSGSYVDQGSGCFGNFSVSK